MALKSTIFKANVSLSNMDTHLYKDLALTIAQHPSETDERMMVRLLAYVLNAEHEDLAFGRGLSNEEDPALSLKTLTDDMLMWIDVGLPDKERVKKASHKADQVLVYVYGTNNATTWWEQNSKALKQFKNVSFIKIPPEATDNMSQMVERTMQLGCSIQDGIIWLSNDNQTVEINLETLS